MNWTKLQQISLDIYIKKSIILSNRFEKPVKKP
jgi:hypothetical protein